MAVGDKRLRIRACEWGHTSRGSRGQGSEVFVLLGKPSLCPSPVRVHERLVDSRRVEGRVGVGARGKHGAHQLGEVRRGSGLVRMNAGVLRRRAYKETLLTGPGRWICLGSGPAPLLAQGSGFKGKTPQIEAGWWG